MYVNDIVPQSCKDTSEKQTGITYCGFLNAPSPPTQRNCNERR